jgi:hypothetical protein
LAIPSNLLLIEPRHLRSDDSRPGDLYAIAGGHHAKDAAMDIMISSSLTKSTLLHTSKSSDYTLRLAENTKFNKDLRSVNPLQLSSTQRFIPLVMNQCGRRGPHFEAMLLEQASLLIKRSSGCALLQGPFAVPPSVALSKVLSAWGNRITWTAQRELAAQVIRGTESHKSCSAFLSYTAAPGCGGSVPGGRAGSQHGWLPNCRTGWKDFGMAGERAGGVISQVPAV